MTEEKVVSEEVTAQTGFYIDTDHEEFAQDVVDEDGSFRLHEPDEERAVEASTPASNRHARRGEARAWLESFVASCEFDNVTNECVLWPFSTNGGKGGRYPQVKIDSKSLRVSRVIYERLAKRTLASDELIRHTCDTPRCVNPSHFIVGSHADNMLDMTTRLRQASGERNGRARLTVADVREIRALLRDCGLKGNASFIARGFGVSPTTVTLIATGKLW